MARSLSRSQSRLQFVRSSPLRFTYANADPQPPHVPIKTLKARVPRLCSRTAPEEGQLDLPTASPGSVVPRIAPLSPSVAPAQRRPSILIPAPAHSVPALAPVQVARVPQALKHDDAAIIYQTQRPSDPPNPISYMRLPVLTTRASPRSISLRPGTNSHADARHPISSSTDARRCPRTGRRPFSNDPRPYLLPHQAWNPYYHFAAQARPLAVQ
jgi:hypothetical protein